MVDLPEETVLRIVSELAVELSNSPLQRPARLDSDLEGELGIDSLARIELLLRVEKEFNLSLPESSAVAAQTPRDLLAALSYAGNVPLREKPPEASSAKQESYAHGGVPGNAQTLLEVLQWYVERSPEQQHIHLYGEAGVSENISVGELYSKAEIIACSLRQYGLAQGEPVAMMLPTSKEFFYSYFGVLLAGAVPVPLYPPFRMDKIEEHLLREATILANAAVRLLITFPEASGVSRLLKSRLEHLKNVVTVEELLAGAGASAFPKISSNDIGLIQYTSGSTGDPKGVVLSHENLLANVRAMGQAISVTQSDVFVSWLPLYHDMGLIGAWFGSLYFGIKLVVMPPLSFIARPQQWLWRIHEHGGTISSAPNFAYEICASKIDDSRIEGLDLSSWRLALNGAEPVSPVTLSRFIERFEPYGFRPESLMPVYGLAENAVGLAFRPLNKAPRIDSIDRLALERDSRAVEASVDDQSPLQFVACGNPLPGHQIRIVNALGHEVGEREEGRLQFRGPSSTRGYYRNPAATEKLFDGDWLDSGDYAYLAEGEVYITGRVKDMIIRGGRNIYPQELEQLVGEIDGIRKGCVAVFAVDGAESAGEQLVIVAETRETETGRLAELRQEINELTFELLQTRPDEIMLAPPRTVPKTSSGKLRRASTRELYQRGEIGRHTSVPLQFLRLGLTAVRPMLKRSRRLAGDLLYGVYTWLLFILIVPLGWLLIVMSPGTARSRRAAQRSARLLLRLSGTPISIHGLDHLPKGACVLVSNHSSYLDSLVLTAMLPARFAYVAKRELTSQFFARLPLAALDTKFVERFDVQGGIEDTQRVADTVSAGESVVFFPEGTLSREPGLRAFHMGAFKVATEASVPVVPVVIRGTRSIIRDVQFFPRRGTIQLRILPAIQMESNDWQAAIKIRDTARKQMLLHCGEPDLQLSAAFANQQ